MLTVRFQEWPFKQRLRYSQSLKPCESQRPIPNHQSSFCSIFLLLLTLSIIRSSCPPSHRWASLGFHFAGLNPISPVGPSGWPGVGRYPKHINWSLGFLRDQFLDPSSSPHTLHHGTHHTGTWLLLPLLRRWHTALSLFSTRWSNGSCTDLRLPGGHLGMDERTSPTAQPGKDWASCRPCHSDSTAWLLDSIRHINNYPINFGQKSWCNLWWPADLQRAIAKTARSCRFALHNIRKIRPFLTEHAAQLLVQALVVSRLDNCNALLAGLPSNTIKPLQMIQMQRHDWSSMSPKEPMLHLSSSHCTGYQWQLASSSRHWCLHTERPQAQHPPTSTHYYESTSPPEVWDLLVSDALWYHHREAQNHSPEHSHSPFLDGNNLPTLSGMLDPCQFSSNNWKLISFGTTWLHPKLVLKKKKKKKNTFPFIFLSFPC